MGNGGDIVDTCKKLEQRAAVFCHAAALTVPYRTTPAQSAFFNLEDKTGGTCAAPHGRGFPTALDPLYCTRYEIRQFAADPFTEGHASRGQGRQGAPWSRRDLPRRNPPGVKEMAPSDR